MSNRRNNVKIEISPDEIAGIALARNPDGTTIIGGAMMIVRSTVHPASFSPEPFSCSRTRAAVL